MALPPLPAGFELEGEVPPPPGGFVVGYAPPPKPLTKDNPNFIDDFLIGKLAAAPGLGNAPDIQGSIPGRVIQGMADLPLGALQLGARMSTAALIPGATNAIDERIKEINARTEQLRGKDAGFDWSRLAGNLASPAPLMAAAKIPLAATYGGRVGQGALIGAGAGAMAPVTDGGEDFAADKAAQIGTGALVGGAIPAIASPIAGIAKKVYRGFIEPRFNSAVTRGRTYLEAAGEKTDDVIDAMRGAKPIVPSSAPTAGEAAVPAASAEFSALQKQAADIAPTPYAARSDAQNAARLASLRTVGQDGAALTAAEQARTAASKPLYDAARSQGTDINTQPVREKINDLLMKNPGNRALVSELSNIKKSLIDSRGNIRTNAQEVSSVIDDLKASIADEKNKFIAGSLRSLKEDLEKAIPGYDKAQQVFRKMSAPVNQMQVGQFLEGKLVPALSDEAKQRASVYATALKDAPGTIKRGTDARFDTFKKAGLTDDQIGVLNSISDDLARGARFEDLARKGAKAAPDISSAAGNQKITGMFSRAVTIANEIIGRLEGKVNKRIASEIAMEMLNPAATADTMAQAAKRAASNKAAASMIEKSLRGVTATSINAAERK